MGPAPRLHLRSGMDRRIHACKPGCGVTRVGYGLAWIGVIHACKSGLCGSVSRWSVGARWPLVGRVSVAGSVASLGVGRRSVGCRWRSVGRFGVSVWAVAWGVVVLASLVAPARSVAVARARLSRALLRCGLAARLPRSLPLPGRLRRDPLTAEYEAGALIACSLVAGFAACLASWLFGAPRTGRPGRGADHARMG